MDPFGSPWSGQQMNLNSGQFYVPNDQQSNTYPNQYYNPSSYQPPAPLHPAQFNSNGGQIFGNSFAQNVAMQYGTEALGQGRQMVQEKVERYFSLSRLKHYFAVDNGYVAGKLGILLCPFFHTRWELQYDSTGVVPPRSDINSPDLYIPVMAFVTYVIAAGVSLGVEGRFAPDLLGILCSQVFGWIVFEVCVLSLALYLLNLQSSLSYFDLLAYSGYKLVHMIAVVLVALVLHAPGYYFALVWTGLAFAFFQIRSLKLQVLAQVDYQIPMNPRRGVYFLVFSALFQPFIIWWLTSSVVTTTTAVVAS
ncbi:unnamed protein product [Hymenolepis diminuta]|uniref:Protein YIF1 n=1 Tax=Hymenolepis diminuta TaxID=6216 RepID=A0A0R3SSN3_HYMDI|nr:unnamed protein product [Hymenolepis diminuta]VUZ42096.1 unnamed protein product [Hymenolepis diminuta]